jgi:hypothetical protein
MSQNLANEVRRLLSYDAETGVFRWRIRRCAMAPGSVAGGRSAAGYQCISFDGKRTLAHRLAWLHAYGAWPSGELDHIDGDKTNNRLANLREASRSENNINRSVPRSNTSGFRGVSWHKRVRKWEANIKFGGRQKHLGYYSCPAEAHRAYVEAATKLHGDFIWRGE